MQMKTQARGEALHHRLGRIPLFGRLFSPDPHLAELNAHLEPGEKIQHAVWGSINGNWVSGAGVLAVSDRRVLRFAKRWVGYDFVSCPFSKITLVDEQSGLHGDALLIHSESGVLVFFPSSRVPDRERAKQAAAAIRRHINATAPQQQVAAPLAAANSYDVLKDIKRMQEDDLITADEYEAKKKELLARL